MAHVQVRPYYDSSGNRVVLGKILGSGGEGDVFEVLGGHGGTVAKIYKKPLSEKKQEKLHLMAHGCNEELKAISAWPTAVLSARQGGPVVGFLMPEITGCEPIHKVYGPTHRKEAFPHADWRFLVRTAKNLAAAFYVIHKFGYVIGDVNEGNILVDDKACVRLIDCDSFQVRAAGRLYPCEVGVAHFTPPEIQAEKHFDMERTKNHDNFGLAILIFQLLFLGRHPYAGVYGGREDMPIEKAIQTYRFAYGATAGRKLMAPPPNSVGLSVVPGQVAGYFEEAFSESGARRGGRPEAGDWWDALEALEGRMRKCGADSMHTFYAGLSSCPWCRLEEASGILIFLSADSITKIDLNREWQRIEAVVPPGQLPPVGPEHYPARPEPLPPRVRRSMDLRGIRLAVAAVIAVTVLLLAIFETVTDPVVVLAAAAVAAGLYLAPDAVSKEKALRRTNQKSARYLWDLWSRKWSEEAGDAGFFREMSRLREQKQKFETIVAEYERSIAALGKTARDRQLARFLARYAVATCNVPGLDTRRRDALVAAGIRTAADVTQMALRRVPLVDNTLANELLAWRERVSRTFLFDQKEAAGREEIQALVHKYQPQIKPVERELKTGAAKLRRIQEEVQKKRLTLRPLVEKRAKELAQAEADYEVFARTIEEMVAGDVRRVLGLR